MDHQTAASERISKLVDEPAYVEVIRVLGQPVIIDIGLPE